MLKRFRDSPIKELNNKDLKVSGVAKLITENLWLVDSSSQLTIF